jgi:hypothetical protein
MARLHGGMGRVAGAGVRPSYLTVLADEGERREGADLESRVRREPSPRTAVRQAHHDPRVSTPATKSSIAATTGSRDSAG